MYEVTPLPIRAEAGGVEGATELCLVSGVAVQRSEFLNAVSKLTFGSIPTVAGFLEWAAHFCLVATGS